MKTVTTSKVICKTDELDFGYLDDETQEFVCLETDPAAVQKHLKLSDEAMDSLTMFVADIKELVSTDLAEIWQRLDNQE